MNRLLLNILLALAWMFLSGDLNFTNFIEGFIIGFIILWISKNSTESQDYFKKIPRIIGFIFYFFYELFVANLRVAYDIITPKHRMEPSIIAIPLIVTKDLGFKFLPNLIQLIPATLVSN